MNEAIVFVDGTMSAIVIIVETCKIRVNKCMVTQSLRSKELGYLVKLALHRNTLNADTYQVHKGILDIEHVFHFPIYE